MLAVPCTYQVSHEIQRVEHMVLINSFGYRGEEGKMSKTLRRKQKIGTVTRAAARDAGYRG